MVLFFGKGSLFFYWLLLAPGTTDISISRKYLDIHIHIHIQKKIQKKKSKSISISKNPNIHIHFLFSFLNILKDQPCKILMFFLFQTNVLKWKQVLLFTILFQNHHPHFPLTLSRLLFQMDKIQCSNDILSLVI